MRRGMKEKIIGGWRRGKGGEGIRRKMKKIREDGKEEKEAEE